MRRFTLPAASLLLGLQFLAACSTQGPLPTPRTVVVHSGERLQPDGERMREVETWLHPQLEEIERNPDFLIRVETVEPPTYPWQTLAITGDTVTIGIGRAAGDANTPILIYAHLRLMAEWGEFHEWVPDVEEGDELSEYEREELILRRVSDVWLLGRSVFDTHPYGPLDELLYATERGLLREFILATQPERFSTERAAYTAENPDWEESLRAFFERTFEREGPGFLRVEDEVTD